MIKHTSPISGIAGYKNKFIATAGYDNKVILWNISNSESLAVGFHDHLANYCEFSKNGKYLVSASSDYSARVWSVPSMQLKSILMGHCDDLEKASFNPNNEYIATISSDRDGTVKVFNIEGKEVKSFKGHSHTVVSVTWINDTDFLTCSEGGTIRQWSLSSGNSEGKVVYKLENTQIDAVASVKNFCFIGDDEGNISILKNFKPIILDQIHDAGIKCIAVNSTCDLLATTAYDRFVKIWNITKNGELRLLSSTVAPDIVWLRSCVFSGDSKQLFFGSFGSSFAKFDIPSLKWDITKIDQTNGINSLHVHNNEIYSVGDAGIVKKNNKKISGLDTLCNFIITSNNHIYAGGQSGKIFDVLSYQIVHQHKSPLNCAATVLTDIGKLLLIGTYTGEILCFFCNEDGLRFYKEILVTNNAIKGIATNDSDIAVVSANSNLSIFNQHLELVGNAPNAHCGISNDVEAISNKIFVTVGRDRFLNFWNRHCNLMKSIKTPHSHSVKSVAYNALSNTIATVSYNGSVAIFSISKDTFIKFTRPTYSGLSSIKSDSFGKQFWSSSYDGEIYNIKI